MAIDQPISLDATQSDPGISLDPGTASAAPSDETVKARAFKASYGLDGTVAAKGTDEISQSLYSGQEETLRNDSAAKLNDQVNANKTNYLTQAIASKQGSLSTEDLSWINNSPAFNTYYDPRNVLEDTYSNTYVSELDKFAQDQSQTNAWNAAKTAAGDSVSASKYYGSDIMAKHEYWLTKVQDIQDAINKQTNVGYGLDFLKMAFPIFNPYYELKMRSNVPGVSFFDGLLGSNLEDQRTALMNMPMDKFIPTVDAIVNRLKQDNPQAALAFAASMLGQSTSDKILNNVNTVGNLTDIPSVLGLGRSLWTKASLLKQTSKAITDQVMGNGVDPETTKANILANTGNIQAAAVDKATDKVVNAIQGSKAVTEAGLDELPIHMRTDRANIAADPGSLTTTQQNIIMEQYKARESAINQALVTTVRPNTIPLWNAAQSLLDNIAKTTFDRYPGMSNAIIRMSQIFTEPLSQTYRVTAWIGKRGGEFFNSEEEALNYARVHNMPIHLDEDQMANLDLRIKNLEAEVKAGPSMEDDAAGLNHHYGLEKQLADLQAQRELAAATPKNNSRLGLNKTVDPKVTARINEIKSELKDAPQMEDDVHGLNRYAALEDELKQLEDHSVQVNQHGLGYYIEVTKPLNRTDRIIRDFIYDKSRASSVTPQSWTRYIPFLNYARTAEDTLSAEARQMRKPSVYGQSVLFKIANADAQLVNKLIGGPARLFRRQEWKDFQSVLKYAQDAIDPATGEPGYFFKNQSELEAHYLTRFNRTPTFNETQAYWANKRWWEMDHALRTINLYARKAELGNETHVLVTKDDKSNVTKSPKFDGTVLRSFPGGGANNVLVMGEDMNSSKVRATGRMTTAEKKEFDEKIKSGEGTMIELFDPELRPFNGWHPDGGNHIKYVYTQNVETSPLSWQQLPFKGGGHFVYDYSHYIKQAILTTERVDGVTKKRYSGDRTVMPVTFRAMGHDIAEKLNQVAAYIKAGKESDAAAFTLKHLPYDWKELRAKFEPSFDSNGIKHPPVFDLNEPFQVVGKNQNLAKDVDTRHNLSGRGLGEFVDDTRNGMARNFQIEFTGKRDAEELRTVRNSGTVSNPVYNWAPADKIDPIQIMNRGLGSIIHSTFMDPYKTYAVEAWLREASPYMKAKDKQIRSAPFYYYKTATKDSFDASTPPEVIGSLLANHFKIEQLVGTPSVWDTHLHSIAQALADSAYSHGDNPLVPRSAALVPAWLLPKLRDPFAFMRAMTFHAYLGLFAIPQMFVQMMTYVNIAALNPRHSVPGTLGTLLHSWAAINSSPEIMNHLDKLATSMRIPGLPKWKPGEWLEANRVLAETGFANVAGEYGPLATLNHARPIHGPLNTFLSWGIKPFQWGERNVRLGAWYTAFKEYRDLNPTGKLTQGDYIKILDKADLLYGNMSTASNSVLNAGIASLPTQFFNYTARLAEQFASKRIGNTPAERAMTRLRILATNAAMFGMPMAFGVSGLPVGDYLRQEMMDNGFFGMTKPYSVDSPNNNTGDWIEKFLMEGGPATLLKMATGNSYNVGPRMGTNGFTQFSNDPTFLQLMGGPSYSLIKNSSNNFSGVIQAAAALIAGDTSRFPFKKENLLDIFKEASSVSRGMAAYTAFNTGMWINKNSDLVKEGVSPLNAMFMFATGLNPQEQNDARNYAVNLQSQKEYIKFGLKKFQEAWNRALIASANKDDGSAQDFLNQAMAYTVSYNIPSDQISTALARANRGRESLLERVAFERLIKNAPDDKKEIFMNLYGDIHKAIRKGQ